MVNRCPPFRHAQPKDPYFTRLCKADTSAFWKIFSHANTTPEFKDLFEKMAKRDPAQRLSIKEVQQHPWYNGEVLDEKELREQLQWRIDLV